LYNRLYHCSSQLIEIFKVMMDSVDRLFLEMSKKNITVPYGQVLLLIIENKYKQVNSLVKEMLNVITNLQSFQKDLLHNLKVYMELFLSPISLVETMNAPKMEELIRILYEAHMRVALSQENHVEININQCQGSVLKSNGDIFIRKEGVIQSDLFSARNVVFFLDNSVCRGTTIEAGNSVYAMIVGGITGVSSVLKAQNKVMIKKMFEGRVTI